MQSQWVTDGNFIGHGTEQDPLSATTKARASSRFQDARFGAAFTACRSSFPCAAAITVSCQAYGHYDGSRLSTHSSRRKNSLMSDHCSGPRALTDPAADLFGRVCLSSTAKSTAPRRRHGCIQQGRPLGSFFRCSHLSLPLTACDIAATGPGAAFAVDNDEAAFDFTFDVPEGSVGTHPLQHGRSRTPNGETVVCVDDEKGASGSSAHVFAGRRSDPFFLDVRAIERTSRPGGFVRKGGSDTLYGTNVLSIVLELRMGEAARWRPAIRRRLRNASGRPATGPLRTSRPARNQERLL